MRSTTPIVAALLVLSTGSACSQDCGTVEQYNTYTYRVMANPVTWESSNALFTQGPEFYSYGTPANGLSEWKILWGGAAAGPVMIDINGQVFEGNGTQDETECGLATIDNFGGVYVDSRTLVEHTFNASMSLNHWTEDGVGRFGAFLIWKESWNHPSAASGTFSSNSHLSGDLISQSATAATTP